jgi:nucleoside-diphosphate-sugar epimerase
MDILVTGACGNVGHSVVKALILKGDKVYAFDQKTRKTEKRLRRLSVALSRLPEAHRRGELIPCYGDSRSFQDLMPLVAKVDAVVHLAAIIPPLADYRPDLARAVNVGGTANMLDCLSRLANPPRLVFASSIAVYGDRVANPRIKVGDELKPSEGDEYARTKIDCESMIRSSGLPWVILRLSYVMWSKWLRFEPLLFRMPLATALEPCHTSDAGEAFAQAVHGDGLDGLILNIGGGERCRTSYREYVDKVLSIFGLGGVSKLPEALFAKKGYHCGFVDSERSEEILHYQRRGLEDYYREVADEARSFRFFAWLFAPAIRSSMARRWLAFRRAMKLSLS